MYTRKSHWEDAPPPQNVARISRPAMPGEPGLREFWQGFLSGHLSMFRRSVMRSARPGSYMDRNPDLGLPDPFTAWGGASHVKVCNALDGASSDFSAGMAEIYLDISRHATDLLDLFWHDAADWMRQNGATDDEIGRTRAAWLWRARQIAREV